LQGLTNILISISLIYLSKREYNRRNNYIKTKKLFNYNIFKINKDKLLLANKYKLNTILHILKDNKEKFLIKKEKL